MKIHESNDGGKSVTSRESYVKQFEELFKLQNREIGLNYDVIESLCLLYENDFELGSEIRRIYQKLKQ